MALSKIGTNSISDDAITTAKLPNDAVTSAKIADDTIATANLADDAITSAKIADGTIATGNIADDAVTGAKIENSPSIADGLTLSDGDLVFASGHGISFAATGDSSGGSMANELLDDYEEGTWTPAFQSTSATFTYGTQSGEYIKIGRVVYLSCRLSLGGSPGGTTTNTTFLTGLPFTIDSTAHYAGSHSGHYFQFNKNLKTKDDNRYPYLAFLSLIFFVSCRAYMQLKLGMHAPIDGVGFPQLLSQINSISIGYFMLLEGFWIIVLYPIYLFLNSTNPSFKSLLPIIIWNGMPINSLSDNFFPILQFLSSKITSILFFIKYS